MKVTILGSGTSSGVPLIGCSCSVCTSTNPKNRRTRASASVELQGKVFLLDTSTDLREQALRSGLSRVDAVLFTHAHADHIHGIDELRVFNVLSLHEIPCYGTSDVIRRIRSYFEYIFQPEPGDSFRPYLTCHEVEKEFEVFGYKIFPIPLKHGDLDVLGYRIGNFAYLTDVSQIPESSLELLQGLELMVLDALRPRSHPTHFSLYEAMEAIQGLHPQKAVLTHMSHLLDYETHNKGLPLGIELAYDGMVFDLSEPSNTERS